jgi:uncharacterized C2H2 Zn-finger protein
LEIPVEISLVSRDHPDENVLEEYVFGRLSDAKTEVLEVHLLLCPQCQAALAETDDYIRLVKFAASRKLETRRRRSGKRAAIAAAGVLAAASIAIFSWFKPHAPAVSVTLVSLRGGTESNQAAAGHPLDLSIAEGDIPPAPQYELEMVTSGGEAVWSGPAKPSDGRLSAHIARSLHAGRYWVRLYAPPTGLLAEYGLQVK